MFKNTYLVLLFLSVGTGVDKLSAAPKTSSPKTRITRSKTISSSRQQKSSLKRTPSRTRRRISSPVKKKSKQRSSPKAALAPSPKQIHPVLKAALIVAAHKRVQQKKQDTSSQSAPSQVQQKVSSTRNVQNQVSSAKKRKSSPSRRVKKASTASLLQVQKESQGGEALFVWPLKYNEFWISSFFGPRKKENGSWGFHSGLDLAACKGTIIYAAGEGIVAEATRTAGYGNYILLEHNEEYKTRYAHLDKIFVKLGQTVLCGEAIGKVGATGKVRKATKNGSGSHLHFEVYKQNKRVNPLYFLA